MSIKIVGHVEQRQTPAYVLKNGKTVTFHTAYLDKERTKQRTFWSLLHSWPSLTASRLGLDYRFMRNASEEEAAQTILAQGLVVERMVMV